MHLIKLIFATSSAFLFISCVSNGKFDRAMQASNARYDSLNRVHQHTESSLKICSDTTTEMARRLDVYQTQNAELARQNQLLKDNNTQALKQLQDLSVITSTPVSYTHLTLPTNREV